MASDWYDEMEKAEQEYDAREYELAQEYSRGYEQGRADKDKELSELPNQYSEKLWKNAYNRGRANAIDEFAEKMKPIATKWFTYGCMYLGDIDTLAEQLKEQK